MSGHGLVQLAIAISKFGDQQLKLAPLFVDGRIFELGQTPLDKSIADSYCKVPINYLQDAIDYRRIYYRLNYRSRATCATSMFVDFYRRPISIDRSSKNIVYINNNSHRLWDETHISHTLIQFDIDNFIDKMYSTV